MLPKLKDYTNKSDMNYFEELVLHNEKGRRNEKGR